MNFRIEVTKKTPTPSWGERRGLRRRDGSAGSVTEPRALDALCLGDVAAGRVLSSEAHRRVHAQEYAEPSAPITHRPP